MSRTKAAVHAGWTITDRKGDVAGVIRYRGSRMHKGQLLQFFSKTRKGLIEQIDAAMPQPMDCLVMRIRMRAALRAVLACPGIDLTDQNTGCTFRELIDSALEPLSD